MRSHKSKALVLSGGGITGIAWELGLLRGLEEGGVDVTHPDLIVGTSAGSSVGAQITSGLSLEELYQLQLVPIEDTKEQPVKFDGGDFRQMMAAAIMSSPNPRAARMKIGEAAIAAPTISEEDRLELLASRLPSQEWAQEPRLVINTVDAQTGEWVTFGPDSGVPLLLAVAASSAVPGVYPPTTINERKYMDGGMSSGTNADVAGGKQLVLILVAEPTMTVPAMGPTMHRISFADELKELEKSGSQLMVITPDEAALEAKGFNPMVPEKRIDAAQAGRRQGRELAEEVKKFWK